MTTQIEFCDECRHHHIPGVCDPNDLTEAGWRAYLAVKAQSFKKPATGNNLKGRQQ